MFLKERISTFFAVCVMSVMETLVQFKRRHLEKLVDRDE